METVDSAFGIFDLPVKYTINRILLQQKYHILQRRWHPDKPSGDNEMSQKITMAYKVLSDDFERARLILELNNQCVPEPTPQQLEFWMDCFEDNATLDYEIIKNKMDEMFSEWDRDNADLKNCAKCYLEAFYAFKVSKSN